MVDQASNENNPMAKSQGKGVGEKQKTNTILMIEDDPLLTKMYKTKFESEGLKVLTAHDGEEGLKLALGGEADLILLDIMMPKLSGVDLLASLRQDPRGKDALVIVYSNLSQEEEAKKAIELGAKEYILKANMTPGQMVEKVKAYLAKKEPV